MCALTVHVFHQRVVLSICSYAFNAQLYVHILIFMTPIELENLVYCEFFIVRIHLIDYS